MRKTSSQLLRDLWKRFPQRYRDKIGDPQAKPLSMRTISQYLEATPVQGVTKSHNLLTRWCKADAEGAAHSWAIPMPMIPVVCHALHATADELDQLMWTRMLELIEREDRRDAPVFMAWLWPKLQPLLKHQVRDDEELQVLEAYRRARATLGPVHKQHVELEFPPHLDSTLLEWIRKADEECFAVRRAGSDDPADGKVDATARERTQAAMAALQARRDAQRQAKKKALRAMSPAQSKDELRKTIYGFRRELEAAIRELEIDEIDEIDEMESS